MSKQQVARFQLGQCILLCGLKRGHLTVATHAGVTILERDIPSPEVDSFELMASPSDTLVINLRGKSSTYHVEEPKHGLDFPGIMWRNFVPVSMNLAKTPMPA